MSKRYIYFKILEPDFSQIWDLCRIIANNINFNYRSNSGKNNIQFFNKFKNPYFFVSIFPIFGTIFFLKKFGSAMHNFMWISNTMPKVRKR